MENSSLKHWPVFVLAAATLAFATFKLSSGPEHLEKINPDLSYEMMRPKAQTKSYDLSGRQIVRTVHTLNQNVAPTARALTPQQAKAQADAAAKAAKDKAAAVAKAKADAAKKAAAQKLAKAKADEARRKAAMAVRVNGNSDSKMSGFDSAGYDGNNAGAGYYPNAPVATDPANGNGENNQDDTVKLTPSQWRNRLYHFPTAQNATAFVTAYHNQEIASGDFYQITMEFLKDSKKESQAFGLSILKQDKSATTFMVLVAFSKDVSGAKEEIDSYGKSPSYFPVLNQVLISKNVAAIHEATRVINDAAMSARNSVASTDIAGRESRGPAANMTAAQFNIFVKTLQRLASSQDAAVAQEAQTTLDLILTLKPA